MVIGGNGLFIFGDVDGWIDEFIFGYIYLVRCRWSGRFGYVVCVFVVILWWYDFDVWYF